MERIAGVTDAFAFTLPPCRRNRPRIGRLIRESDQADRTALRRALGARNDDVLIGALGPMEPIEAPAGIMEAFFLAVGDDPGAHLVFAGPGDATRTLEARASALGLGGRVHVLGTRLDAATVAAGLDVLLVPAATSPVYGQSALMRGLAAGTAIVAEATPEAARLVLNDEGEEAYGSLAAAGNPGGMALKLAELVRDQARRRAMGRRARGRAERLCGQETALAASRDLTARNPAREH